MPCSWSRWFLVVRLGPAVDVTQIILLCSRIVATYLRAIDRLVLIRVKIEWAKKHLSNLAAESLALKHTTVVTRDEKTGVPPHPIAMLWGDFPSVPTISFDAVCLAGDVIHNLRAALDHLAQHLALVGCPALTDKELRQVEFPIAETPAKYEADKARKVKGMKPEAIERIDRLKPYRGGNDALWRLHALDNIDKHRTLFTFGPEFIFTSDWFTGTYHFKTDDPHFTGIEGDVETDIKRAIEKALDKPESERNNALLPMLHDLVKMVDDLVRDFEALLE
jgi:hypothetical protein